MSVLQNTLYLMTPGTVVSKSKQTLKVTAEETTTIIPVRSLSSVCSFGAIRITPPVLSLCLNHQVSVHFHTKNGFLLGQVMGSGDTRYLIRRAQYEKAANAEDALKIAKLFVAGKIQNSRINLLRSRRDTTCDVDREALTKSIKSLERFLKDLSVDKDVSGATVREALDPIRGLEGICARNYFDVFSHMIKKQRDDFIYVKRFEKTTAGSDQLFAFVFLRSLTQ